MGFWLTLTRHDPAEVTALLDHPDGPEAGRARLFEEWSGDEYLPPGTVPKLRTIEEVTVRRAWDALHVALTGYPNEDEQPLGDIPARNAVLGGLVITSTGEEPTPGSRYEVLKLLTPADVQAVDRFLRDTDRDDLLRRRQALLREVRPYSFGHTVGPYEDPATGDMLQNGSLARAFDTLRGFYACAAAAGNAVIKELS